MLVYSVKGLTATGGGMRGLDERDTNQAASERAQPWPPPPVPVREVRRRRLHALIEEGLRGAVTVVAAPAGTGKSRLLACFCDAQLRAGRQVRWLAADQHADLGAALLDARGIPLPRPAPSDRASRSGGIAALLKATVPRSPPPGVVIVDDAHLLRPSEVGLLSDVLIRCPSAVRVVLVGRRNPLPASMQLALGDTLTVIRGRQLLFDDAEARQLVLVRAPGSTRERIDAAISTSRGWAAPLVMSARALSATDDDTPYGPRLEHVDQQFLDHLLSDCFATMSNTTKHVLMACCQEDDVDAEAALALSGVADAASHLSVLAADGLVTSSLDPHRPGDLVWRLHPLLKEALRRLTAPTARDWPFAVQAHVRAAYHYDTDQDAVRALRHSHRSGDAAAVTAMLTRYGALLVPSEAADEVAAGLLCLPATVKAATPHLVAIEALLHRAHGRIDVALEQAHLACDQQPVDTPTPAQAAAVASVRLWRASLGWGPLDDAVDETRQLLGCTTSQAGHTHAGHDLTLAQAACLMVELAAAETWYDDPDSARVHLHEAQRAADVLGSAPLRAAALAHRSILEFAAGAYRSAADTAAAALADDPNASLPADVRARAQLALGWSATYALNPRAARTIVKDFAARPQPVDPIVRNLLTLLRCRILNQDGQGADALRLLASARVPDEAPRFLLRISAVIEGETAARAQSLEGVRAIAIKLRALGFDAEAEMFECVGQRSPAEVSATLLRLNALLAEPALHPATAAGAAAMRMTLVLQHAPAQAHELLADFLSRVHPERLLVFLDIVAKMSPKFLTLLQLDVTTGASHPAAPEALTILRRTHTLPIDGLSIPLAGIEVQPTPASTSTVAAISATTDTPFPAPSLTPSPSPGTPPVAAASSPGEASNPDVSVPSARRPSYTPSVELTQRQADVLAQLAAGASYADIARNLYVTENTVKTHLIALYRKLDVNRRSEALRRARELGLL